MVRFTSGDLADICRDPLVCLVVKVLGSCACRQGHGRNRAFSDFGRVPAEPELFVRAGLNVEPTG